MAVDASAKQSYQRQYMTTEQIAQVCHEANRAFCSSIGDNSQHAWDAAPQWQRDSAV